MSELNWLIDDLICRGYAWADTVTIPEGYEIIESAKLELVPPIDFSSDTYTVRFTVCMQPMQRGNNADS